MQYSHFFFLSNANLMKLNMQEDNVIDQIMKQSASHKVFVKWTDAYLENAANMANYPTTNVEGIQFSFASCMKDESVSHIDTAKRAFYELVYSNQDPRVNLIILTEGSSGLNIAKELFALIDQSSKSKSYCLWGGETFGITDAKHKENEAIDYRKPIFMGIRLFASSMKSWSLITDFRQFEEKIIEFKKHVQLKRYSLAFVSGRSAVIQQTVLCNDGMQVGGSKTVESFEYVNLVQASFPNTIIYGGFNLGMSYIFGLNSSEVDDSEWISGDMARRISG